MAPRKILGSCTQCLAWGMPYNGTLCRACVGFQECHRTVGVCEACRRRQPLNKDYCRLCWCQAYLDRQLAGGRTYTQLRPFVRKVRHHQLFLAGMVGDRRDLRIKPPRRNGVGTGARGLARKQPPVAVARPSPQPARQLRMFDDLPRTYRRASIDRRYTAGTAVPDNAWLAWGMHLAHITAEARGWGQGIRQTLEKDLIMLLADYQDGERIRYSDYKATLRNEGGTLRRTTELLTMMGILFDDRPGTFARWLDDKLRELAPGIRQETQQWADTLCHGGPRTRARDEWSVRAYVYAVRPPLLTWSQRYDHLREVTRDDVLTYLTTLRGERRHNGGVALRSLFGWAKRQGRLFSNPMLGIKNTSPARPIWQPLQPEQIARAIHAAAASPHTRVFVALGAIHAARPTQIRTLRLADADLANRLLTIADRTRPLDELTHRILRDWLTYRRGRWPNTANTHLLINPITALNTEPVSHMWIKRTINHTTATIEQLRIDRQLEEAVACGADPLHLASVFGISERTAIRYADNARALTQSAHDDDPSNPSRTPSPTPPHPPDAPSGSS